MLQADINAALQCVGAFSKRYQKGEFILLEQEKMKCIGCVLHGSIEMLKEDIWGNKTVLITIGQSELFGESFACQSQEVSEASFVAREDTNVLFLPFQKVLYVCSNACSHHQSLLVNMVTLIAQKNNALMKKLDIMSKKTLREKLVAYLNLQASNNHSEYFTIPLGRVALAEYLSVDRSALTRELNAMKKDGLIDFDKNTFRILRVLN